jgi:hypothetical protein
MRQTLTAIILILTTLAAKADLPGPAYQYDLYSQNKSFYYKSIPFYNYDQTNFGKTIVYDAKTKKKLYQIDNYLPRQAFLSNNGKSLITTRYWMWGHDNFDDQELIEFYVNGKKSKKYFVKDLISDRSKLQFTSSHTLWYDDMFIYNDTLFVLTLDNKAILIDANKAEIIGRKDKSFVTKRFDLKKLPQLKSVVYDKIKYPEGYQFPDLITGRKFRTELIKDLNKTEVKDYDSCKFYIMIYGAIDRKGNCDIFVLSASVNKSEEDDPQWKKQVADWVTKQKYKTNLIPVNCDKWVFQEYFYLK